MIRSRLTRMMIITDEKGKSFMEELTREVVKNGPAHSIKGSLIDIVLRLSLVTSGNVLEVQGLIKSTASSQGVIFLQFNLS